MVEPAWSEWKGGELSKPEQFRLFYAVALPRVYSYFYRRCGRDANLAEDLTQEVFMAVVAALRQGTVVGEPVLWALGIARHKLLDHYRRQRRLGWTLVSMDDAELDDTMAELALMEAVADGGDRALTALESVPSQQREALTLRYLDGCSVPEIADALGRSIGAAESLLVRGRVAFRRSFLEMRDGD